MPRCFVASDFRFYIARVFFRPGVKLFKQHSHQGERKKNNLHNILYPDRQIILGSCDNLKSETQDRMMTCRWRQSRSRKGEAWIEQNKKQQKQKEILRDVFFQRREAL